MRRKRVLLLVALGLAVGLVVVLRSRSPQSNLPERPAPPVEKPRKSALQSDAEGYYIPGYAFTVGRFRFASFSLRPEGLVTFAQTAAGIEEPAGCVEAGIRADTLHLRCDYPQVGTVSIDGKFLTRFATATLGRPVVSAVGEGRGPAGGVLYKGRDPVGWPPRELG